MRNSARRLQRQSISALPLTYVVQGPLRVIDVVHSFRSHLTLVALCWELPIVTPTHAAVCLSLTSPNLILCTPSYSMSMKMIDGPEQVIGGVAENGPGEPGRRPCSSSKAMPGRGASGILLPDGVRRRPSESPGVRRINSRKSCTA